MSDAGRSKILVVEDDKAILYLAAMFLESDGYFVMTAENGRAALELISERGMPDLILLDMLMPVMDGWQFVAKLRKDFRQTSPIIVMSAAADVEGRGTDVGADYWIGKPFDLDELSSLIRKCLSSGTSRLVRYA